MTRETSLNIPAVTGPEAWEWRGEVASRTRRQVKMLIDPAAHDAEFVLLGLASIPPGHAAPWHRHIGHEEFCTVLSGHGEFWTATERYPIGPGDTQLVAPGELHTHRQVGEEPLVFLWGYAPPGPPPS